MSVHQHSCFDAHGSRPTGERPNLFLGNCLDRLTHVADRSVSLVIADLPYGGRKTNLPWDVCIDLKSYWAHIRRVLRPNGTVLMFGAQPFTTDLLVSNRDWFRYSLVWEKSRASGFQMSKTRVMMAHEDILVFSEGVAANGSQNARRRMTYNPQGLLPLNKPRRRSDAASRYLTKPKPSFQTQTNFPRSVLKFDSVHKPVHPTEKPLDLLGYLVRTFSNPGDVVLDPTMGSGSTGVAALAEQRSFIGIELDPDFYRIASDRLANVESGR